MEKVSILEFHYCQMYTRTAGTHVTTLQLSLIVCVVPVIQIVQCALPLAT